MFSYEHGVMLASELNRMGIKSIKGRPRRDGQLRDEFFDLRAAVEPDVVRLR
jgi:hypothetical protein